MGRPREFEVEDALDAAKRVFWRHGYEATSLADLMAATGLHKGSLYKAFGDKRALFGKALARYLDEIYARERAAVAGQGSPRAGLRALLRTVVEMGSQRRGACLGCFGVNTIVELGPHDPQISRQLDAHLSRLTALLERTIEAGQDQGEFRRDQPATALAQWVLVFTTGLLASLRGPLKPAEADNLADLTLSLLG